MILPDVPIRDYVADAFHDKGPSLSSSVAHCLLSRSPLHARVRHPLLGGESDRDDTKFDLGTATHAVLLEGKRDLIVSIDVEDRRGKKWSEPADAARAEGRIPLLAEDAEAVERMVESARAAMLSPDLAGLGPLLAERTVLWQEDGTWCRCRPDWLTADFDLIVSFKTCGNAEPEAFGRHAEEMGYTTQAAFELAGVEAATGIVAKYVWLAVETKPPYAASLTAMAPDLEDLARRKFRAAVTEWAECLRTNTFPGYPARVCYLEAKPWAVGNWIERENRGGGNVEAL